MRSHPAKHGEGFDAPPTIKRSGSEHRRAVFLFFPEGRRPRREVEPSLMVKKDGMILEKSTEGGYILKFNLY